MIRLVLKKSLNFCSAGPPHRAIDAWLEYLPLRADTLEMVEVLEILCGFIRRYLALYHLLFLM